MNKKTIRDINVAGKRVLVRVDFNVPLKEGAVSDDTRIRAALPTLNYLLEQGAALILCSHLGRPKGADPAFAMDAVAARLGELLGRPVQKVDAVVGPEVQAAAEALQPGQVLLLENTRFEAGEKKNDPDLAAQLADLADVYVDDAFGSAHRAHASTAGVAQAMKARGAPAVAGFLMEKELEYLGKALEAPDHPFVALLGGAKISDKIGVIESLLGKVDILLIGGGMANTFLKAQGYEVGRSLVQEESVPLAKEMLRQAGRKLVLPEDAMVADEFDAQAASRTVLVDEVPHDWRILDIGPITVERFGQELSTAKTIVWNGPMGVFEFPRFAAGTIAIAQILAETNATTIIGGGDSVAAVKQAGLADKISHISTGGGASLEFLEGKDLPGVVVLDDADWSEERRHVEHKR
jgi:phosphoglycerate kinase